VKRNDRDQVTDERQVGVCRGEPAATRRTLLGGIGGLALALKALLAPQAVHEAAAARNRNNNDPGPHKTVILLVENLTTAPINLEGWHKDEFDDNHRGCKKKLLETISPPNTVTFSPHDTNAIAWINQTYFIAAAAPLDEEFPFVQMSHGGTIGRRCIEGSNIKDLGPTDLGIGQQVERTIGSYRFVVLRENNINKARVFRTRVFDAG
jgi:hypothetical protein